MCAGSKAVIGKEEVFIDVGYYGGIFKVGKILYDTANENTYESTSTREEFIEYMNKFTKQQLIKLIADLIENAEE